MSDIKNSISDQDLIDRLAHIPLGMERGAGMIRIRDGKIPKISKIGRNCASSIGKLDKFPLELMHTVLDALDFQSISRFSRTSLRANAIAQSLRSFKDLTAHAPKALAALTRTTLVAHHSAATLHAVLQSQNCSSCRHWYGPYLFLPTCVRVCWICLFNNRGLWVIPRGIATRAFGLSLRQVDQLPTLRIIPDWYQVGYKDLHQKKAKRVVCVASVKKLAATIHGSEDKVKDLIPQNGHRQLSWKKLNEYRHYRAAPIQALDADPILIHPPINATNDEFGGVATIEFASLTSAGVEHGLWCKGCDWVSRDDWLHDPNMLSSLLPPKIGPNPAFMHLAKRSRSREDFLRHIQRCYGARHIAEEDGLGHWVESVRHIPINHWT